MKLAKVEISVFLRYEMERALFQCFRNNTGYQGVHYIRVSQREIQRREYDFFYRDSDSA